MVSPPRLISTETSWDFSPLVEVYSDCIYRPHNKHGADRFLRRWIGIEFSLTVFPNNHTALATFVFYLPLACAGD